MVKSKSPANGKVSVGGTVGSGRFEGRPELVLAGSDAQLLMDVIVDYMITMQAGASARVGGAALARYAERDERLRQILGAWLAVRQEGWRVFSKPDS